MTNVLLDDLTKSILIRYTASKGLLDQLENKSQPLASYQETQRHALKYIHEQGIENQVDAGIKVSLRSSMKVDQAVLKALGIEVK